MIFVFKIHSEEGIYSWVFAVRTVHIFKFFFTSSERWKTPVFMTVLQPLPNFDDFKINT